MILDLVQTIAIINLKNKIEKPVSYREDGFLVSYREDGFLEDNGTSSVYQANKLHSINLQLQDQRCFSLYGVQYSELCNAFGELESQLSDLHNKLELVNIKINLAQNRIQNPKKPLSIEDKIIKCIVFSIPIIFINMIGVLINIKSYFNYLFWVDILFFSATILFFNLDNETNYTVENLDNETNYTVENLEEFNKLKDYYSEEFVKVKLVRDELKEKINGLLLKDEYIVCDDRF